MSDDRFAATDLIETEGSIEHAAEVMAGEQSAGTFVAVQLANLPTTLDPTVQLIRCRAAARSSIQR